MPGRASLPLIAAATLLGGCSAIVSPDESRLGEVDPSADAGPISEDSGPRFEDSGPGVDSGPAPDAGPELDAGPPVCAGGDRCAAGVLTLCEDGVARTVECPLGCAPGGEPRCADFLPSNVGAELWSAEASDLTLDGASTFVMDTGPCTSTTVPTHVVPQEEGPELCVIQVGRFTVEAGSTLSVRGRRPLVIMASGDVTLSGTIDASARGTSPGPGGFRGGLRDQIDGAGPTSGTGGTHEGSFDDGGGGGGGLCGGGGDGGQGGTAAGGNGGGTIRGGWELAPLLGGSGGGRGRGRFFSTGTTTNAGLGGGGGGAVQISSRGSIRITAAGHLLAGGGGGLGGGNRLGDANWGSGGGGGSGGAILLEALAVQIDGHVVVAGGGGGGSASGTGDGTDGEDGAEAVSGRARGGLAGDLSRGANGGDSAGGTDVDALPGEDNLRDGANGGGGGGGSGCVLVRTGDGTVSGSPAINPAVEPAHRLLRVRTE